MTFVENLEGSTGTEFFAMDEFGTAMGRGRVSADLSYRAVKWTLSGGLEDVSSTAEPWYDLETNEFVEGWIARSIRDFNSQGQTVGGAYDGTSGRAYVHDDVFGYSLLPRIDASAGHEAWVINNQSEIQGGISNNLRTFFWSPTNPNVISVMEAMPRGMNDQTFLVWDSVDSTSKLFSFLYVNGSLLYEPVTSISARNSSIMDDSGYFTYLTDGGTTQTLWLYRPAQSALKVSESASLTLVRPWKVNSSGDFVYAVADVPYLYRHSELRSYRLYDLSDSYTKSTLFVDTSGQLKYAQFFPSVTSDDDVSNTPSSNPFDSITGWINPDSVVLTPIPK
ncbi:MAG: hypothetical protein FJ276_29870 [Planctomycetes bacterium]|nr:hypothetical protein [Planctomycetota bacterium]